MADEGAGERVLGAARVGPLFATWPFAAITVSADVVRIRMLWMTDVAARADGDQILYRDTRTAWNVRTWSRTGGAGSILFTSFEWQRLLEVLVRHGWQPVEPV